MGAYLYGLIKDGDWVPVNVDGKTFDLVAITPEHQTIHAGKHYFMEGYIVLSAGETHYFSIKTPNSDIELHFTWEINTNGVFETALYEEAEGGMTGGTAVSMINNDRNSSNSCSAVITSGCSAPVTNGTLISSQKVGGTAFKSVFGGNPKRDNELILKKNTQYVRVCSSETDGQIISFRASLYEQEGREG